MSDKTPDVKAAATMTTSAIITAITRAVTGTLWLLLWLPMCCALLIGPARAADDFLEPDQAFRLSARAADGATLELRYQIAPGYYMYRERFEVVAAPAEVRLGTPVYPAGKVKYDETFQKDVETHRGDLRIAVPVTAAPGEFKLTVTSQGCADKGLCYPPRSQVLRVQVSEAAIRSVTLMGDEEGQAWQPAAATATVLVAGQPIPAAAAGTSADASAPEGVEAALRSGSLWTVVGVFLLAGLLLSFTPCVLPMMPILSSIIVGQGAKVSRLRGFGLSLAYCLGMALVYTAMGVAAGLAGEGLAAALQKPVVLGGFAALLVILSLSMFGWYELQLPAALQNRLNDASGRLQGGRVFGVFLMGGLSALIVGPCVAAPLAGALVYISQSRDVLLGGVALFALAAGMSVPLLLLGLSAGSLLPRAGAWMEGVKRFFGVLLLGTALWMLDPVLPVWLAMLAWGALALGCAVELRAFDRLEAGAGGLQRVGKAIGLLIALIGLALVVGMLSGGRSLLQPLVHLSAQHSGGGGSSSSSAAAVVSGTPGAQTHGPGFRRVSTVAELDEVLKTAGRPVMLDFYADWCVSCKEFELLTFSDPAVRARLDRMLLLQADVTANHADDKALLKRFQLFGPPGIVFFDAQGREVGQRVIGFQDASRFLASLEAAGVGP